jgi:hypothetical protein
MKNGVKMKSPYDKYQINKNGDVYSTTKDKYVDKFEENKCWYAQ